MSIPVTPENATQFIEWLGWGLFIASEGVGMGQAAQGDSQTFLAAWALGLSQGLIATELAEHVAAIAEQHDLPAAFIAALVPDDGNL